MTKNPLRFDNLLGGLTELRKDALCMIMVYCNERTEIKSSKGRKLAGWSPERPGTSFQLSSPSGLTQAVLHHPAMTSDHREEALAAWEARQSLSAQATCWEPVTKACSASMTDRPPSREKGVELIQSGSG